jgi:excisionase family DNA binding protein
MSDYLTTKELARLLRIKERKVYDLAASGEIPCSRAMGKLLFPRRAVDAWLARHGAGFADAEVARRANVFLGSHDPLLDWTLGESRCGLATFFDGSHDGLARFAAGEGIATGLHIYVVESEDWNLPLVRDRFAGERVVLVEWAWRERGLIVSGDVAGKIAGLADLKGRRVARRQAGAGSEGLFDHLLAQAGLGRGELDPTVPLRSESEAALAVFEGKADVAFGLRSLATRYRLAFVPVVRERFDLLVERRAWFEPPFQRFLAFCRSTAFTARAEEMGGYDISGLGRVLFNGA